MQANGPNRAGLGMRPPISTGQGPPIGSLPSSSVRPFVPGGPPPIGLPAHPMGAAPVVVGGTGATLFIGSISAGITDAFLNELLSTCGPNNPLKRMITPTGKPQGFGFVEYPDPESAVRAVTLLNGIELPAFEDGCANKKLLVKPDEKTRMLLDAYSAAHSEEDPQNASAQESIKALLERVQRESTDATNSGLLDREKYVIPPHLHDLQEADLPDSQRMLITNEIALFREQSAKREREKMKEVLRNAEAYSHRQHQGTPTQPKAAKSGTGAQPPDGPRGFGKGPQGYDKPVAFVKSGDASAEGEKDRKGKTDLELEEERREARRAEETRSFKDRERRYEPRERARINAIEKAIARDRATREAEERDRDEMRHRLDIWDDDESDELFYVDRSRWRSMRSRRLNTEEQADAKSRRFDEQEAENLRRESEDFLAKQMEDMQALAEEQRKAGMLLDDGIPVKLNVAITAPKDKDKDDEHKMDVDGGSRRVFGADEEEEEESTRRRRKANLQKLEVSVSESVDVEKARERLGKMKENVPTEKDKLWKYKVRWDAMSENMVDRKFEPLVKRLMNRYLGEMEEDDLILFVLEHLKDHKSASKLVEGLEPVLEEEAVEFTIAVWRQVVFESIAYGDGLLTGSMMIDD